MKLTQSKKVFDIVHPPFEGLPLNPQVGLWDPVTRAVELMLEHDLKLIAVSGHGRLIGHVRLSEALECLGLHFFEKAHTGLMRCKSRQQDS